MRSPELQPCFNIAERGICRADGSWPRLAVLTLVLFCLTMLSLIASGGCATRSKDSAGQEQKAMDTLTGRSWYDSKKVAYRPPTVSNEYDTPIRVDGWENIPKPVKPTPTPAPRTGRPWSMAFWDGGLSALAWILIGALLIILAILLAGTSVRSWHRKKNLPKKAKSIEIDPARVVDLPFETRVEMDDPLESARRLAMANDFNGAVLYLYGYMLLALDRAGQIVLHRGKTNRMYMFELADNRTLRELLTPAMLAFEDVFFGRHDIDRARFTVLWNNLDAFHRELQPIMQGREQQSREQKSPDQQGREQQGSQQSAEVASS